MRRALSVACFAAVLMPFAHSAARAVTYAQVIDNWNLVGMTLTNYGVLGNNFTTRAASLEYPYGSGYEHMTHAGLWIGAQRVDSGYVGVTTGTMDAPTGSTPAHYSEFTPTGDSIDRRSSLPWSQYFDPSSVSEADFITDFDDLTARTVANSDPHHPLGVQVRQYVYGWSALGYQHFLHVRYVIHNVGGGPLANAWVGLYSEFASGNKAASSSWPPSGWWNKRWLVYDPDFRMVREHYCTSKPVPSSCQLQNVPYWIGAQLLTPPDTAAGQHVTLAAWPYNAGSPARSLDSQRYAIMSAGTIVNTTADSLMPGTGDPVELLAVGPFATIAAGDSVTVEFALVGGAEPDSIREHAYLAQRVRDLGYPSTYVAAQTSLLSADSGPDGVHLRWDVAGDPGAAARIERSEDGGPWQPLAELEPGVSGLLEYLDRDVRPGGRYAYRLGVRSGGAEQYTAPVWIDVPATASFALLGARPNPLRPGEGSVRFTLAEAGLVRLDCYDLLGRREAALDLGRMDAGEHVVPVSRLGALRPAVHVLRLAQAGRVASSRIVTLR